MDKYLSPATAELLRHRGFRGVRQNIDAVDILAHLPGFALVFDPDRRLWMCYDTLERGEKRVLFLSYNPAECCAFCWVEFNYGQWITKMTQ